MLKCLRARAVDPKLLKKWSNCELLQCEILTVRSRLGSDSKYLKFEAEFRTFQDYTLALHTNIQTGISKPKHLGEQPVAGQKNV